MLTKDKRVFDIVTRLQAKKEPLLSQRLELNEQLKELLASIADKEKELRAQIKSINDQITPLDLLASEATHAALVKSENGKRMLLDDIEARVG